MVRVFVGLGIVTAGLIALCSFLVSLHQSKKERRLAQAQEREKKENLGEALYDACHEMDATAHDIRVFCRVREFDERDDIDTSLANIGGILEKTSKFIRTHPKQAGKMDDVITHLLPLVRKMMDEYDLCIAHGAGNVAAQENLKIIDKCLHEISSALDRKLSAMFEGRAYDLQAELFVLESQKEEKWKLS